MSERRWVLSPERCLGPGGSPGLAGRRQHLVRLKTREDRQRPTGGAQLGYDALETGKAVRDLGSGAAARPLGSPASTRRVDAVGLGTHAVGAARDLAIALDPALTAQVAGAHLHVRVRVRVRLWHAGWCRGDWGCHRHFSLILPSLVSVVPSRRLALLGQVFSSVVGCGWSLTEV
jgi:hypothetical protein